MSVIPLTRTHRDTPSTPADVDIVVPVYNEEGQLAHSITALRAFLDTSFPFVTTITIADNASTDGTWDIASHLSHTLSGVSAIHLDEKGRGRALRAAWTKSTATVVSYMDVDLATGLDALLPLVAPLLSGHSDVAIGTRLGSGAHVVRGTRREFISRAYNLLLRTALRSECTDAQCGFKAMRRHAAAELLPLVEDDEWFFDTEVLVTAQRIGLRIHEVPVDWVDDVDSRVQLLPTAIKDLRGIWRMLGPSARRKVRHRPATPIRSAPPIQPAGPTHGGATDTDAIPATPITDIGTGWRGGIEPPHTQVFADELLRFAGVGAVSTVAYLALFAALEPDLGPQPTGVWRERPASDSIAGSGCSPRPPCSG
jgi:hypothetical protein